MPRQRAQIITADIRRILKAAKRECVPEVVIQRGDTKVIIRLTPSTTPDDEKLAPTSELDDWLKRHADAIERH